MCTDICSTHWLTQAVPAVFHLLPIEEAVRRVSVLCTACRHVVIIMLAPSITSALSGRKSSQGQWDDDTLNRYSAYTRRARAAGWRMQGIKLFERPRAPALPVACKNRLLHIQGSTLAPPCVARFEPPASGLVSFQIHRGSHSSPVKFVAPSPWCRSWSSYQLPLSPQNGKYLRDECTWGGKPEIR